MGAKVGHIVSAETRAKIAAKLRGRRCSPQTQFKKGTAPHNKGARRWLEGTCQNPACGAVFRRIWGYASTMKYCSLRCAKVPRTEHRIIAERVLGRALKVSEIVHHLNANKADNDPRNLLICTNAYHRALEHRMSAMWQREHFPSYLSED